MVKLRVEGVEADVHSTVAWLRACFLVREASRFYPNQAPAGTGRVYVTIEAEPPPTVTDKEDSRS